MRRPFERHLTWLQKAHIDLEQLKPEEAERLLELIPLDAFIIYAFRVLIDRVPDASGLKHYRQRGEAGGSRASIAVELMASSEFLERHGHRQRRTMPLDAYIRQTYHGVLGRAPDEGGMQTYIKLGRKWRGRQRILSDMRASTEGRRTGGGRLERIAGFRRLARRNQFHTFPLIGRVLGARWQQSLRLFHIELTLAALVADPSDDSGGNEYLTQIAAALGERGKGQPMEAELLPISVETADKKTVDQWVFDSALRDARRHKAAKQGGLG